MTGVGDPGSTHNTGRPRSGCGIEVLRWPSSRHPNGHETTVADLATKLPECESGGSREHACNCAVQSQQNPKRLEFETPHGCVFEPP